MSNSWSNAPIHNSTLLEKVLREYQQITERMGHFIQKGQHYQRAHNDVPIVWAEGSSSLCDYGKPNQSNDPIILCIPSLINRSYILDLNQQCSLVRFLAEQHIHPYMLDWQHPEPEEYALNVEQMILKRVVPALQWIVQKHQRPVILLGYCMGGIMALAAAQHCPQFVSSLALLATPWDFHSVNQRRLALPTERLEQLAQQIKQQGHFPASWVQSLFYSLYPDMLDEKFLATHDIDLQSLDIEYWVNDGIHLSAGVAVDCFIEWSGRNALLNGQWKIGCQILDPTQITQNIFIASPQQDRIVPPDSTEPLITQLGEKVETIMPNTGHVGMVVGKHAKIQLWNPLINWIEQQ